MTNILLSTDAGDVFYAILIIVSYVLSIILFFKVWRMTNDVREIKKHFTIISSRTNIHIDDFTEELRKNAILGNIDIAKKILLKNFYEDVQNKAESLNRSEYKEKSIRPYVDNLRRQFGKIGEDIPDYIAKMETFADFFNLYVEKDFL